MSALLFRSILAPSATGLFMAWLLTSDATFEAAFFTFHAAPDTSGTSLFLNGFKLPMSFKGLEFVLLFTSLATLEAAFIASPTAPETYGALLSCKVFKLLISLIGLGVVMLGTLLFTSGALKVTPDLLLLALPNGVPEALFLEAWLLPTRLPLAPSPRGIPELTEPWLLPTAMGLIVNVCAAPAATRALRAVRLVGACSCNKKASQNFRKLLNLPHNLGLPIVLKPTEAVDVARYGEHVDIEGKVLQLLHVT